MHTNGWPQEKNERRFGLSNASKMIPVGCHMPLKRNQSPYFPKVSPQQPFLVKLNIHQLFYSLALRRKQGFASRREIFAPHAIHIHILGIGATGQATFFEPNIPNRPSHNLAILTSILSVQMTGFEQAKPVATELLVIRMS